MTAFNIPQLYTELCNHGTPAELVGASSIRITQFPSLVQEETADEEGISVQTPGAGVPTPLTVLGRTYEIHPWSADVKVPVLYFSILVTDGTIERQARVNEAQQLVEPSAQEWISVAEHPITGLRTLFLHPCNTIQWLDDTQGDWWLWLQCFGPLIGLRIHY